MGQIAHVETWIIDAVALPSTREHKLWLLTVGRGARSQCGQITVWAGPGAGGICSREIWRDPLPGKDQGQQWWVIPMVCFLHSPLPLWFSSQIHNPCQTVRKMLSEVLRQDILWHIWSRHLQAVKIIRNKRRQRDCHSQEDPRGGDG